MNVSHESRGFGRRKKKGVKKKKERKKESNCVRGSRAEMWEETKTDKIRRLEKLQPTVIEVEKPIAAACQGKAKKQKGETKPECLGVKENQTHTCGQIMIQVKHRFGPRPAGPGHGEVRRPTSISKEEQDSLLNGPVPPLPATTE